MDVKLHAFPLTIVGRKKKKLSVFPAVCVFGQTNFNKVCLFVVISTIKILYLGVCLFSRCATCHSAWRRCSAGISSHTTLTGPWQNASCAIRSSPGTTTSKYIWRMSTGKQRARANYGTTGWKLYLIPQIKFSLMLHFMQPAWAVHTVYTDG